LLLEEPIEKSGFVRDFLKLTVRPPRIEPLPTLLPSLLPLSEGPQLLDLLQHHSPLLIPPGGDGVAHLIICIKDSALNQHAKLPPAALVCMHVRFCIEPLILNSVKLLPIRQLSDVPLVILDRGVLAGTQSISSFLSMLLTLISCGCSVW